MTEILIRIMEISERFRTVETIPTVMIGIFGVLMVFGIMNCVLGYRLLRFWVMLFGFAGGAFAGLFAARSMGTEDKMVYLAAMVIGGIVLGIIAFLVYRFGIFVLGAGLGMTLSVYILHPTTSAVFFLCILIGVAIGALGVRFAREVIIVGISLLGGIVAGYSLTKIGGLAEFPYALGLSAGFAVLGLIIQFATNHKEDYEEDHEDLAENHAEDYEDDYDDIKEDEYEIGKDEERSVKYRREDTGKRF